jgi:DNA-directed RNA polymerase subunit RPC12/RpoP
MSTDRRWPYRCPNIECGSGSLVPIGRDPRKKNSRGYQQLVYECQNCGKKVDEITLEGTKPRQ